MTPLPASPGAPTTLASPPEDEDAAIHRRAVELREHRMGRAALATEGAVPASPAGDGLVAVTYPVLGMTCRSCEVRISRIVSRVPGVERVSASAVRGQVTVESNGPVSTAAIASAVNKAGYEIGRTPWVERDPRIWATAGAGLLLVAAFAVLASATGLTNLASGAGELSRGGIVVALLLGLAAGVSTCMALVGGLVLGLSAAFASTHAAAPGVTARLRPAAVFVGGRIVGYAVFGAVLGAVGASITMPPQLTAVLMIAVAILMTILGTRLTGLSPRMAGWSPTLPMGLGTRLGLTGGGAGAYSDVRAASLGALTFFLPCGFTQAVQVYALSTGSPAFAAALLGTFAIGTAPGLLAVAGLPVVVPSRARPTLLRLVGVVVLGFAFVNATSAVRLSGVSVPSLVGVANAAPLPGTLGEDGIQRITTYQDGNGYSPADVVIYAGYPTRWTVESSDTATCAASLWAPGVGIRARLQEGPNTFDLPALPAGTLDYTCAMGMYAARITVVEPPTDATGAAQPGPRTAAAQGVGDAGPDATSGPTVPSSDAAAAPASPGVQELRTWQDQRGYGPSVATIVAGVPTRWTIESRSQASCAAYMVVPSLGIERELQPGDNVIDLPALDAGVLEYTCGMGMDRGTIVIEAPA